MLPDCVITRDRAVTLHRCPTALAVPPAAAAQGQGLLGKGALNLPQGPWAPIIPEAGTSLHPGIAHTKQKRVQASRDSLVPRAFIIVRHQQSQGRETETGDSFALQVDLGGLPAWGGFLQACLLPDAPQVSLELHL